jgi:hypothetical protein
MNDQTTQATGATGSAASSIGSEPPASGLGTSPPPARPDWVPETFFDAQQGIKFDDFGKHYKELAERDAALQERAKSIPDKPEAYKIELPQDFKIEGLPEGVQIKFNEKDPTLAEARALAKEIGLPQADFSKFLTLEAKRIANAAIEEDRALAAEKQKLGDKAVERISGVDSYLKRNLSAAQYSAIAGVAKKADAIEALEVLIAKITAGVVPNTPNNEPPEPPPLRPEDVFYKTMKRA